MKGSEHWRGIEARNWRIYQRRLDGLTGGQLGEEFGISATRALQICHAAERWIASGKPWNMVQMNRVPVDIVDRGLGHYEFDPELNAREMELYRNVPDA
jgi:hypothetical protein